MFCRWRWSMYLKYLLTGHCVCVCVFCHLFCRIVQSSCSKWCIHWDLWSLGAPGQWAVSLPWKRFVQHMFYFLLVLKDYWNSKCVLIFSRYNYVSSPHCSFHFLHPSVIFILLSLSLVPSEISLSRSKGVSNLPLPTLMGFVRLIMER